MSQIIANNNQFSKLISIEENDRQNSQRAAGQQGNANNQVVNIEEIMKYCTRNFRSILPTKSQDMDSKQYFFPFHKTQIINLIRQFDTFIQLLVQNLILTNDEETRVKNYNLLISFDDRRRKLKFWNFIPDETRVNLSTFTASNYVGIESLQDLQPNGPNFRTNKCTIYFYPKAQISLYQSHLLDFLDVFREIMRRNHDQDVIINILQEQFSALVDYLWLPTYRYSIKNSAIRTKFAQIEDALLLIGLRAYGCKDFNKLSELFFDKNPKEIKNRYKNLICTRAPDNIIKTWKQLQSEKLTEHEKKSFLQGLEWFGDQQKWHVISKYFLPHRSAVFLEAVYKNNENKKIKRALPESDPLQCDDIKDLFIQGQKLKKCHIEQQQQQKKQQQQQNEQGNNNNNDNDNINNNKINNNNNMNILTQVTQVVRPLQITSQIVNSMNNNAKTNSNFNSNQIINTDQWNRHIIQGSDNLFEEPQENIPTQPNISHVMNFEAISLNSDDFRNDQQEGEIFIDPSTNQQFTRVENMVFEIDEIIESDIEYNKIELEQHQPVF